MNEIPYAEKPPLGITPRWLHREHRIREITAAMTRYFDAKQAIPEEWSEELVELLGGTVLQL